MKVLLVFPPQWIPYRPYLSLPSLAAYLEDKGINVVQKDVNAETYDLMLSEKYLLGLHQKLDNKFRFMESKDQLDSLVEQQLYNDLFFARSTLRTVAGKVEQAKALLRGGKNFYDADAVADAIKTIDQATAIISMAYFPIKISLSSMEVPSFQGTLQEINAFTQSESQNPYLEIYRNNILPDILEQSPDVIGISITGYSQLLPALTLSRLIKSSTKNVHVVLGGNLITALASSFTGQEEMFGPFLDSAIVYEGERPLLDLVEHLRDGQGLDNVPNLIHKENHTVMFNQVMTAEDINSLPTPSFDGLPLDIYLSPEPILTLRASRGCYWHKCAFCSHSLVFAERYHNRDASKIADDMQTLSARYGTRFFAFADEAIAPSLMSKLCDQITLRKLSACCSTNIRMERQWTAETCGKMARSGFGLLYLGLESGCDRVLGLMNKGITSEISTETCRNTHAAGIWNHAYLMFGFPGETKEEAEKTIEFLQSNAEIINSFSTENFSLERGMEVQRSPERFGVVIDQAGIADFGMTFNYETTSGLSHAEARKVADETLDEVCADFAGNQVLKKIGHYYLPLYLDHYHDTDPFLIKLLQKQEAKVLSANRRINRRSVPRIKDNIIIERITFDLAAMQQGFLAVNTPPLAYCNPVTIAFDPETGKLTTIPNQAVELLSMCNGKNSIKDIALELSRKYRATPDQIEKNTLELLGSLAEKGYLQV